MLRPAVAAANWARAEISGFDMRGGGWFLSLGPPAGTPVQKCLPRSRPSTTGAAAGHVPLLEMRRFVVTATAAEEQQHHQADADKNGKPGPQRQRHITVRRNRLALRPPRGGNEKTNPGPQSPQEEDEERT